MAAPKRAKTAVTAPISVPRVVDPSVGFLDVNVFDGTRQPIKAGTQVLLTLRDGFQNERLRKYVPGPNIPLQLPIQNNLGDDYAIIAFIPGSEQAGFQPIHISPSVRQTLDLMLLPKKADFHFAQAKSSDIQSKRPALAKLFPAGDAYSGLVEDHPNHLACLLNITTAMQQILLAQGTPLDYFKELDIESLAPDRFFGYADAKLVSQVRLAAQSGVFETEPASDLVLHTDATSSFKQLQFGEANVQLAQLGLLVTRC